MKKTRRTSKVGELVRDALVDVFRHDLKTDLGFTSITEAEVSPDLHFAHVYISGLKEDETRHTVERLQELRGRVRKVLGARGGPPAPPEGSPGRHSACATPRSSTSARPKRPGPRAASKRSSRRSSA